MPASWQNLSALVASEPVEGKVGWGTRAGQRMANRAPECASAYGSDRQGGGCS
jgi:hypothetical protein